MQGGRQELTDAPRREDVELIERGINQHNIDATGRDDARELAIFVRDGAGAIVGGLYGWTWAAWLEVRFLWLESHWRGQGHGTRMLQAAEAEARARGCQRVLLDSYSFQAPEFYLRQGYEAFGTLHGFPEPHSRVYMTTRL